MREKDQSEKDRSGKSLTKSEYATEMHQTQFDSVTLDMASERHDLNQFDLQSRSELAKAAEQVQ